MRHKKNTLILGRKAAPRRALLRTLAISLIEQEKIQTTPAKARAVRRLVEPLITKAKKKDVHSIRQIEKKLANKTATMKVVNTLGPRFEKRPGGYTSIVHVAPRQGDGAKQVILKFVTS